MSDVTKVIFALFSQRFLHFGLSDTHPELSVEKSHLGNYFSTDQVGGPRRFRRGAHAGLRR